MPKFVPRQRKHKVRQRKAPSSNTQAPRGDPNATEILPPSQAEREEKRQRLREELRAQQPKISSKKQKRLDKYIDTKLKKEENLELIKRLAKSKIDTTLLKSSKTLGAAKESKREVFSRALKERAAGINVESNNEVLLEHRHGTGSEHEDISDDDGQAETILVKSSAAPPSLVVGSGLKRPLEIGDDGQPIIATRKRRKNNPLRAPPQFQASTWEGIQSDEETGEDPDDQDEPSLDETASQSSDEPDSSSDSESPDDDGSRQQRSSAFKAWANKQLNEALGFQPSANAETVTNHAALTFTPRVEEDPLPPELQVTNTTRKAYSRQVQRTAEAMEARLALPVVAEEQKIMEAVHNNPVVVIWGATGSGKTTQVPQFLYEAGYGSKDGPTPGMIGVTQPRRVAAVSMAKRVGNELGGASAEVAYKACIHHPIRFEATVSDKTVIKFMTDGILLREASEDITLGKYSAIVIDEVHERTKDTDILIGMMSRIVRLREELSREDPRVSPLRLIIMSATLKVSDFTQNTALFSSPPPLIQAEGRQHSVTMHWARKTKREYLEEMYLKVSRGHRRLPPGGILIFLTGQNEITQLSRRFEKTFSLAKTLTGLAERNTRARPPVRISADEAPMETEDMEVNSDLEQSDADDDDSGSDMLEIDDDEDDFDMDDSPPADAPDTPMHVLPLYSLLPTKEQLRVFESPPEGSRLVVLATNIAETSLTIPGIRYVFDSGRAKQRKYDDVTGVQSFEVDWISKASAKQRAGRAGRTGPGHCYRLYSSAVYERDFAEYAIPEILRTPMEGVVLQLSAMNVPGIIDKFPFPTPPDQQRLIKAQKLLTYLGALTPAHVVTDLGRRMSNLPLSPRFAKILLTGHEQNCLPYIIAIVAALSIPDVFIPEGHLHLSAPAPSTESQIYTHAQHLEDDARTARRKAYNAAQHRLSSLDRSSDGLKLLCAVLGHAASTTPDDFCTAHFLRPKAMRETQLLRAQLHRLLRADPKYDVLLNGAFRLTLPAPSSKQVAYLKFVIASGFVDQVAIRWDLLPTAASSTETSAAAAGGGGKKKMKATNMPY
ncbi:MAG: putative ATP-dependent RNA helicase DHR1, partial [Thelocarpon superellum]